MPALVMISFGPFVTVFTVAAALYDLKADVKLGYICRGQKAFFEVSIASEV